MNSKKAIIVADDAQALPYLQSVIRRRGYEVLTHDCPAASLLQESQGCPCPEYTQSPDVIVIDVDTPSASEVELLDSNMKKGCCCQHIALISAKGLSQPELIRMVKCTPLARQNIPELR